VQRQELNWTSYSCFKLGLLEDAVAVWMAERSIPLSVATKAPVVNELYSRCLDAARAGRKGGSKLGLWTTTLQPNEWHNASRSVRQVISRVGAASRDAGARLARAQTLAEATKSSGATCSRRAP
jgi:hypothetical protein